ncbi:nucleoside triphosphate pyrophosphohydrolase [Cytobacillus sp. IB215316]|uniref:nucleoside triphosphate pyrophosphohydrolase n=1 Tax=Cytobacillus sp. IB215316 TaxID=3097354 RepID=UPI002A16BBAA|nr:nucleoside triphosphate pyrophosphohydrolase [Cytobacillus sp. IB215316]MDX8361439.1 nucleoside triphosphate pyrophosphohydrolase [Cytobacillus sp. IB215316]
MPLYNKLVRDYIPQIIEQSGKKYRIKHLSEEEYTEELKKKLIEEMQEYLDAKDHESAIEELADVLELIHALAKVHHVTIEKVDERRDLKNQNRGGFKDKVFLIDVEDH